MALKAHGTLRGLVPYDGSLEAQNERIPKTIYRYAEPKGARMVREGGHWSLGRILMESLFYNPHLSGRWGAATLDPETYSLEQRQRKGAGRSIPAKYLLLERFDNKCFCNDFTSSRFGCKRRAAAVNAAHMPRPSALCQFLCTR